MVKKQRIKTYMAIMIKKKKTPTQITFKVTRQCSGLKNTPSSQVPKTAFPNVILANLHELDPFSMDP